MHFERHFAFQMHKIIYFSRKKKLKNICVPTVTLPKIFRPVARNTLILFGLNNMWEDLIGNIISEREM